MRATRVKRLFAVSAIGVLMAGGALGAAGTASAATPSQSVTYVSGGGWDHDRGGHHHGWHDNDNDHYRGGGHGKGC
ncbi:hypothetical protein ACFCYM_00220 [Streptomyces sp. NPDC056254]|uniref:hypothetical protein n=1 Tax=unclassified Streptomyces TaxID=2593676 RepID=UPI000566CA7A|nr:MULTISPECIES: hypothetical protein [unclassified Streptomyces]KJK45297.1 hypothetical protein UK14_26430 [Streptomyces sp. NRRL F-4428]